MRATIKRKGTVGQFRRKKEKKRERTGEWVKGENERKGVKTVVEGEV